MIHSTYGQDPFVVFPKMLAILSCAAFYHSFYDMYGEHQASYYNVAGFFTSGTSFTLILITALVLIVFYFIYLTNKLRSDLIMKENEVLAINKELREIKKDLNHAQSVAHIGSWRISANQDKVTWSDETYRIFNLSTDQELSYQKFLSMVHPEDRELITQNWENALNGETYDLEYRIICGSEIKWIREKAELEFDEHGNPLGIFGITQDITELKHAEEELKASRQQLERIAETSPDIIFILDVQNNKNVYSNRSVSGLLGYSQEEFRKIEKITEKVIHPEDVKSMGEFY